MRPHEGYLKACAVVDYDHPGVSEQAERLREVGDPVATAQRCFEFVRDAIAHSLDIEAQAVTCSASEVLQAGHGLCYAKSHLLTALLRANGIPAGADYQRLVDGRWGHVLHGLSTVWLDGYGWQWLDARGGPVGAGVVFEPGGDMRVFSTNQPGEIEYLVNLQHPLPGLVRLLNSGGPLARVVARLPADIAMG